MHNFEKHEKIYRISDLSNWQPPYLIRRVVCLAIGDPYQAVPDLGDHENRQQRHSCLTGSLIHATAIRTFVLSRFWIQIDRG